MNYEKASVTAHQDAATSTKRLAFSDIKQQTTDDGNDCFSKTETVNILEDPLSQISNLVISYRNSLESSYQKVTQENVSKCPYGSDIYDVCGNRLPPDTGFYSSGCHETSYCNSGVYGRSLNGSISFTNKTINSFPPYSVSYILHVNIH